MRRENPDELREVTATQLLDLTRLVAHLEPGVLRASLQEHLSVLTELGEKLSLATATAADLRLEEDDFGAMVTEGICSAYCWGAEHLDFVAQVVAGELAILPEAPDDLFLWLGDVEEWLRKTKIDGAGTLGGTLRAVEQAAGALCEHIRPNTPLGRAACVRRLYVSRRDRIT